MAYGMSTLDGGAGVGRPQGCRCCRTSGKANGEHCIFIYYHSRAFASHLYCTAPLISLIASISQYAIRPVHLSDTRPLRLSHCTTSSTSGPPNQLDLLRCIISTDAPCEHVHAMRRRVAVHHQLLDLFVQGPDALAQAEKDGALISEGRP